MTSGCASRTGHRQNRRGPAHPATRVGAPAAGWPGLHRGSGHLSELAPGSSTGCVLPAVHAPLSPGCLFIALCDLPSIRRRGSRRRAPAFPRLPRLRRRRRRLRRCPPPPPTLISSDPRSPARCLAHRMSPRRPRPAASPPPTAAAHNPPPPPGFPTPLPLLLRPPEATGPGNPEPRRARTLAELAGEDEQGRRRASATAPLPPARAMNSFPQFMQPFISLLKHIYNHHVSISSLLNFLPC